MFKKTKFPDYRKYGSIQKAAAVLLCEVTLDVTLHKTEKTILLFVREQGKDENGRTMGFVDYGEVKYQSHNGSQPMNITWELTNPMPSEMWHDAGKLAVE